MEFAKMVECGDVTDTVADGLGRIDFPTPHTMRLWYYQHQTIDGIDERRLIAVMRWDRSVWLANSELVTLVRPAIVGYRAPADVLASPLRPH